MAEVVHLRSSAPDLAGPFVLIEHSGDLVNTRGCVLSLQPAPELDEFTPETFGGLDEAISEGMKLADIYSLDYVYVQNV